MSERHTGDGRRLPDSDARLRDLLLAEGCSGPVWQRFATELARYGYAVLMAWLRSEVIFTKCAEKGCWPGPPPPYWEHDDRAALAVDTVVKAISEFRRKALLEGGWSPDGGTSLKSYFTTTCVYAFPNHYRRWRREFDRRQELGARTVRTEDVADRPAPGPDPAELVVRRLEVRQGLAGIPDERTQRAVVLREAGYSVVEIAELLETTPGAVKGALERLRKSGGGRSTGSGGSNV
ncbi:RNA polymerase sigma factor [Saccharothrix coeruleofusca]|uniref:DNA-directed RNA polymerase specialized sigma24 family protein n=1 Tax=Saccharothrix coeruleofusca TaxID=33919 RepID=A0A918AJZ4_9PSEU|nr:hypothetical protein [Saccharothrix coeruleofusca]MBP2338445.1 DNA-directed RNA polymerase specialized sigma24 family protein [Saccharothrix coeruleofusca]GGP48297.1 hypothetical protein GCM10010185_20380 [Saccharothrix coeruleofusca]